MKKNVFMFMVIICVMCFTSCTEYRYVYVPTNSAASTGTVGAQTKIASAAVGATYTVSGYLKKYDTDGNIWVAPSRPIFGYPVPATKYTGFYPGEYSDWVHGGDFVTLTVTASGEVVNFVDHTAAAKIRHKEWRDMYGY